jgi:hypothetical protein
MIEAPKRIWIEKDDTFVYQDRIEEVICSYTGQEDTHSEIEYVRADLVDGLIKALEELVADYESEEGYYSMKVYARKARIALDALKEVDENY